MESFNSLRSFVSGYKTYLVAIVGAVLNLLVALNVINVDQLAQVNSILVALGAVALRSAVKKAE